MADITMCTNQGCLDKDSCYRWLAEPNPRWQSYSNFEGSKDKLQCSAFWKIHENDSPKNLNTRSNMNTIQARTANGSQEG
jgi:hypothetical protein